MRGAPAALVGETFALATLGEIGHQRAGLPTGKPVAEAQQAVAERLKSSPR